MFRNWGYIGVLNPIALTTHHPARASNIANAPNNAQTTEITHPKIPPLGIAQNTIMAIAPNSRIIP